MDVLQPALPDLVRQGPADELEPRLVEPRAAACGIGNPDQDRRAVGHQAEPRFARLQRRRGLPLGGDVAHHQGEAHQPPSRVAHRGHQPRSRDDGCRRAAPASARTRRGPRPPPPRSPCDAAAVAATSNSLATGLPDRLVLGISGHPLGTGVPARDRALDRHGDDGVVVDVLDQQPVSLLARAQRVLRASLAKQRVHRGDELDRLDRPNQIARRRRRRGPRPCGRRWCSSPTGAAPARAAVAGSDLMRATHLDPADDPAGARRGRSMSGLSRTFSSASRPFIPSTTSKPACTQHAADRRSGWLRCRPRAGRPGGAAQPRGRRVSGTRSPSSPAAPVESRPAGARLAAAAASTAGSTMNVDPRAGLALDRRRRRRAAAPACGRAAGPSPVPDTRRWIGPST